MYDFTECLEFPHYTEILKVIL